MIRILALLLFATPVFAQLKGPEIVKPGQVIRIKLESELGDDPKFDTIPKFEAQWDVYRNFNNPKLVTFQGQFFNEDGTDYQGDVHVLYVDNKDKKTIHYIHKVTIGKPKPLPDVPTNELFDRLKAAYRVSPDEPNLPKIIAIYEIMSETTYTTISAVKTDLATRTKTELGETTLKNIRAEVTKILTEKLVGPYDQKKTADLFKQIATTLKNPNL